MQDLTEARSRVYAEQGVGFMAYLGPAYQSGWSASVIISSFRSVIVSL